MSKMLATDLDGTLFYPKKRIKMMTNETLQYVRRFIDDGGIFTLVSGRNNKFLEKVQAKIGRPVNMVCCNGAFISTMDGKIKELKFDTQKLIEVLQKIEKEFKLKTIFVMSSDNRFVIKHKFKSLIYRLVYFLWNHLEFNLREPTYFSLKDYNEIISSGKARKVMLFFGAGKKNKEASKNANKIIREKYGDIVESCWSNEFIELSPIGSKKSEGLKYLAECLKIKHSDVYVVGDSGNDISMFNEFPEQSFCMSHASLSVSKYAKHVIEQFSDLEKFIDLERK